MWKMSQNLSSAAVVIGALRVSNCSIFVTEAGAMISILYEDDLDEDKFRIFTFTRNIY